MGLAVMLVACSVGACARDIAVVANKQNGVRAVSEAELAKIAKGTMTRWPDGTPVTLVLRIPVSPEMKLVNQKLYGMDPHDINSLIFEANLGRPESPAFVIVNSDEAVLRKVMSKQGAVGLVDVYSITSGVKVLRVGGKLPLEHGYLLHEN